MDKSGSCPRYQFFHRASCQKRYWVQPDPSHEVSGTELGR
jgi:hypothetical protein